MDAEQIRDGVRHMQQGDKAATKGLFRKPDWDVAAGYYERAATSFKIAKSYDQAVQAYLKQSDALYKADATHLAGKAMENAAYILASNLNQPQRAADAYQRASNYFMTQGSIDRAAEQLEKAGRALENVDVNASYDMYNKAITIYEQEDRGRFAIEIFKKTISLLIRNKKYDKAVEILKRQCVVLQKFTSRSHLYKANLSIIILILAIGDDVEAGKQFNMMCGDTGFAQTEEAEIAEDLLRAYAERDQLLLEKTVRLQHLTFLDNEIVKLARLLTVPGEMLSNPSSRRDDNRPLVYQRVENANNGGMSYPSGRNDMYDRSPPPATDMDKSFSYMRALDDEEDDEGLR
ncbi:soluble NSF attachment protein [Pilobolus umbonatus]|nr:soluble NSF attachment protein [Pilobolus umbonatus]